MTEHETHRILRAAHQVKHERDILLRAIRAHRDLWARTGESAPHERRRDADRKLYARLAEVEGS